MDVTKCIGCGAESSRFRIVIDLDTDREIGCLCRACLTDQFGQLITHTDWRNNDGCAICDRDAFYGLPEVRLCRETRGASVAMSRFEYALDAHTLRFCDEHLTCLSVDEMTAPRAIADGGSYQPNNGNEY